MIFGNVICCVLFFLLCGVVIIFVYIDSVLYEFFLIIGVCEDVMNIVLNIKEIVFKVYFEGIKCMVFQKIGFGVVCVGDIEIGFEIEVLNFEYVICNFDDGVFIYMEFIVDIGKGYVFVDCNCFEDVLIGFIFVDVFYSLVCKVFYKVENICEG